MTTEMYFSTINIAHTPTRIAVVTDNDCTLISLINV